MKKSFVVVLHIGFWMCFLILIMVMLGFYYKDADQLEVRFVNAFKIIFSFIIVPSILSFYAFYFVVFPLLRQKNFTKSVVYGLFIAIGAAWVGYACLVATVGPECFTENGASDDSGILYFMTFISLIPGIVALVIKGFITWFDEIKLKEALQQKNHDMELALVKSQLDPHFLFNTINNIDVLILKDATEASNYLIKLSDIMRFMLFETKTDKILLAKEIEYIEKYIALQKIRTANANYVNFEVVGSPNGQTIAPMVFIPFIENAFKHTTNKKLDNAIAIKILVEQTRIKFVCENKIDLNRKIQQENNGLGNDLIQKRLNLLYPANHQLKIINQKDFYGVELIINKI